MALYFEGTSTGNRYEVGRTYEMNGREYTAQSDGSFVREGSRTGFTTDNGRVVRENDGGHSLVGSSQDPSVRWYASGADSLTASRYSPGSSVSLVGGSSRSGDTGVAAMAANGAYQVRNPVAEARFRAAAQGVLRGTWSGKDDPPQDLLYAGQHLRAHSGYTNAELAEARYSDFMSSVIGIPIFGADLGNTWAHMMGPEYFGTGRPGWDTFQRRKPILERHAASAAEAAGEAAIGALMSGWDALRAWGAAEQSKEQREAEIAKELYDAYGLRDMLEAQEAAKVETPRRSQAILGGMGVFGGL